MKTSRLLILFVLVLASFFAARWGSAQSTNQPSAKRLASSGFGALDQLASFVSYLQETKQTNTLDRFNTFENASLASREFANLSLTLEILQRLRDGRTNQAYELLEGQLASDIVGFVGVYRELPDALRDQRSLRILRAARDYRAQYPFKHRYQDIDERVTKAFKILDEKGN